MKALVFNGPRDVRYESFDDPELTTDNGVILKVNKCSICGSDLHMYHGEAMGNTDYAGHVEKFCVGHEFMGEVVETGRDVHTYKVGDRVLSAGGAACGYCESCRSGNPFTCRNMNVFGVSTALHGGQAEYVLVPNADMTLMAVPEGVNDEQALLLTDAMATACFGIVQAEVKPGDTVTVVGLGPIGLIGVELALAYGASRVFAVDPVAERRAQAALLGATALTPEEAPLVISEATDYQGSQAVFEASGAPAAVESALGFVARGGIVSFVGIPKLDATLSLASVVYKNVTVRGGIAPINAMWPTLVPLLQNGRIKAQDLFSHHMNLSEGSEAYRMFDAREDGVIKIMIDVA